MISALELTTLTICTVLSYAAYTFIQRVREVREAEAKLKTFAQITLGVSALAVGAAHFFAQHNENVELRTRLEQKHNER